MIDAIAAISIHLQLWILIRMAATALTHGNTLHQLAASAKPVQATEASYQYDAVDTLSCNGSDERSAMQQTLNLHWAYVPAGSNADLMRAVTHAPTQIGVRADGWAWQYYKAGVVPCNADAIYPYTTRE